MHFEWDPQKNVENIRNHDLDFSDAWMVFRGLMVTEADDRFDYGETRTIGIGLLRDLIVILVFTERENDIIRVISFRKALKHERERFYRVIQNQLGTTENDG